MKHKAIIEEKRKTLVEMTAEFCDACLDEEYKQLCEKLILKISRKRNVPFLYGHLETWAAAAIHTLGSINLLFDPSFKPYASRENISNYFSTSKSTVSQKAKVIRDMFKMGYWDDEFSTIRMMENKPFLL